MHFEGISGRQIRSANLKHSNRASSYRNYTCTLLAIFSPLTQNCLGSEPPRGCRLRDKPRYMGALRQHTAGHRCYAANHEEIGLEQVKIGSASGRERGCKYVEISVVAVALKKKK